MKKKKMNSGVIDFITLGCSKNLVDCERLMAMCEAHGFRCTHDSDDPQGEIVVINTCGFIADAKEESINTILEFVQAKAEGCIKRIYVMGCLSERYLADLEAEIPEVDGWYGKFNYSQLLEDLAPLSSPEGDTNVLQRKEAPSGAVGGARVLAYMGFHPGQKLLGTKVDYVFLGACTNGRIEDFRAFASIVKGRQKAADVVAWLVPGSWAVDRQIREEGLDKVLEAAGFQIRQPGCSACLAMNDDKVPAGKYCVSTSNRNFEGRQGPGSRTILCSPLVAAAAAVTGVITDPRTLL